MPAILSTLLMVIYSVMVVGVILVIITDNRNPLKSLPWMLVLILVPVVGLVLYFFFGQDLSKRRIISRRTHKRITTQLEAENPTNCFEGIPERHLPLAHLLNNSAKAIPLHGSRIETYTSGEEKMEALLTAIRRAKHHIHLQYYILLDDATGRRLCEALIERARAGVAVRVLYDDVGSHPNPKLLIQRLQEAGVEIYPFLPVRFPVFTSKVNYRNHRKIVVIDGLVGFLGGMNIADRYVEGLKWGSWRDNHFRVEGRGVAGLQASFLSDWSATTQQCLTSATYYPPQQHYTEGVLQLLPSGPFGKWRTLLQADSLAISQARQRIWIQTPYYLPSEVFDTALKTAALAGVDVRLMLPERSDASVVNLASHSYLDDLLRAGVKVLFYRPGFLHAKLLLIDDSLAVIGSANLDFRSFEHNFEITGFVYDREFVARIEKIFEQDSACAARLLPRIWFRRSRLTRLFESLMRLFAPLL